LLSSVTSAIQCAAASASSLAPCLATWIFGCAFGSVAFAALPQGVASGDTDQTSTVLWAASDTVGNVLFEVSTDPAFGAILDSANVAATDPLLPVKQSFSGLSAGTQYYYRATDSSSATVAGNFRTPAAAGTSAGLRFGVSGDWRGELSPYPAVRNVPDRNLDFFSALGDTIYADFPSPALPIPQAQTLEDFRIKHREVYSSRFGLNTLADLRQSTTLVLNIDDHEVIDDFAGGAPAASDPRFGDNTPGRLINDTQLFDNGLQAFHEYNPLRNDFYGDVAEDRMDFERKLYRANRHGQDAAVFNLDARSFRDAPLADVTNPSDPVAVGTFLANSYFQDRTILGRTQLADLKLDLSQAQADGVTWKFVLVPEPIQNLGVVAASDRFEGYARERADLLRFIDTNDIQNVVFIAADIHGTLVNNVTYENVAPGPGSPEIQTGAFEITTGAVAFDAPFGPTVANIAFQAGLLNAGQLAFYNSLPVNNDPDSIPNDKDDFIKGLVNAQLAAQGYDPIGIEPATLTGIDAELLQGDYAAVHTYGWTEFEIDPVTQQLLVTTYGIAPYTEDDIDADPSSITSRMPFIVSQFRVTPVPEPTSVVLIGLGGILLAGALRRRTTPRQRTSGQRQN